MVRRIHCNHVMPTVKKQIRLTKVDVAEGSAPNLPPQTILTPHTDVHHQQYSRVTPQVYTLLKNSAICSLL